MSITIEIPKMKDFNRVNKLAKQVHELHVNWRPDLFLSVDEVISKECFEKMIQNRGKGIGTALLNYTKEHGKANNCTDIYLTVNEENKKAIKVYEEFGFKVKSIAYSMLI